MKELRASPIMVRQELRVQQAQPGWERFTVPPWGWIEGLEIDFADPIPAMQATDLVEVEIQVRVNGQPAGNLRARSIHRNVEWQR